MVVAATVIQIATLIVAAVAVAASVIGIIITSTLNRRSEHRRWQRDLRVRLYSALSSGVQETIELANAPDLWLMGRHKQVLRVGGLVSDVLTFGSRPVAESARELFEEITKQSKTDLVVPKSIWDAREKFLAVVRHNLKITEDVPKRNQIQRWIDSYKDRR